MWTLLIKLRSPDKCFYPLSQLPLTMISLADKALRRPGLSLHVSRKPCQTKRKAPMTWHHHGSKDSQAFSGKDQKENILDVKAQS